MKTDRQLQRYVTLTRDQAYFCECWFNLVHAHSLDSYRVRVLNARNCATELERMYFGPGNTEDRTAVRRETYALLKSDLVLDLPPFVDVTTALTALLADQGPLEKSKEDGQPKVMLGYFLSEFGRVIDAQYVPSALARLEAVLIKNSESTKPEPLRFEIIEKITNCLLSVLLDRGISLESLFQLYSQVLIPRLHKDTYKFERKWWLLERILTEGPTSFQIVFAIDNVSNPGDFPPEIGGIKFSQVPVLKAVGPHPSVKKYLAEAPKRIFASLQVESSDPRAAGARAADKLNDIINLVRFEYERSRITVSDEFAFVDSGEHSAPRVFPVPMLVPNPTASVDGDGLSEFVRSVDELVANGSLQEEGRERVYSAFRLYRTGLDASLLEIKLTSWWTALEYLVRGSEGQPGGISKAVESLLVPVLCNSYTTKHILAIRHGLLELGLVIVDPASGQPVEIRSLGVLDFYVLICRADIQAGIVTALTQNPFIQTKFIQFCSKVATLKALASMRSEHEQRLRWHIQRLWRARCDIVHSAGRSVNYALLCANLEYYLKVTLMALLKGLRDIPTLSGPREFFDRQAHQFQRTQAGLLDGDDMPFLRELSA
jgi:hypothetical protein